MTDRLSLYDPTFEHDACGVGMVADLTAKATHATVSDALTILENLEHRGATGSDVDSGDGAGLLVQMPDAFVREVFGPLVPDAGTYGVAFWMIPRHLDLPATRAAIDEVLASVGLGSIGWREVPSIPRSWVPPRPRVNQSLSSNSSLPPRRTSIWSVRCSVLARFSSIVWTSTPRRVRPTC